MLLFNVLILGQSESVKCGQGIDCSTICSSYFNETEACLRIVDEEEDDNSNIGCDGACNLDGFYPSDSISIG